MTCALFVFDDAPFFRQIALVFFEVVDLRITRVEEEENWR
jgi:hypothetical protein